MAWRILKSVFGFGDPLMINDSVLGKLTYKHDYWISDHPYSSSIFLLTVAAPRSGPTDAQRDFFKELMADFIKLEALGRSFVEHHQQKIKLLNVYTLEIRDSLSCSRGEFIMEFSDENAAAINTVHFVNWKPEYYGEDD